MYCSTAIHSTAALAAFGLPTRVAPTGISRYSGPPCPAVVLDLERGAATAVDRLPAERTYPSPEKDIAGVTGSHVQRTAVNGVSWDGGLVLNRVSGGGAVLYLGTMEEGNVLEFTLNRL